jgi:hypothetical protein
MDPRDRNDAPFNDRRPDEQDMRRSETGLSDASTNLSGVDRGLDDVTIGGSTNETSGRSFTDAGSLREEMQRTDPEVRDGQRISAGGMGGAGATIDRTSDRDVDPAVLGSARARGENAPGTANRVADDLRRDASNPGDEIGEAVGGISGVLTGAALGSLGGPIGTIIGGIAGAVSGWWAGRAISEAASHVTDDDEHHFQRHYADAGGQTRGRDYETVRPAYQVGHLAGRNPDYANRPFDDVERDLRHGWNTDVSNQHGDWDEVRDYARHAYERGRTSNVASHSTHASPDLGMATGSSARLGDTNALGGGTGARVGGGVGDALTGGAIGASHPMDRGDDALDRTTLGARDTLDRTGDRLDHATDRLGDRTEHAADRAGNALERAWDKTKDTAHRAADKVEDAFDDTKDRVDGNPASRPGLDRTDRPERF